MGQPTLERAAEHLESATRALATGEVAAVERESVAAVRLLEGRPDEAARALLVEAALTLADVYTDQRRDDDALRELARVRRVAPDCEEACCIEARLRLLRWELREAEQLLDRCRHGTWRALATYQLAVVAELGGRQDEADRLYAEAARLDPEECPPPVRIDQDEAQAMLAELAAGFPADVRAALDNLQIDVLEVPESSVDASPDNDPVVLGLYQGVPITDGAAAGYELPPRVRIFKRNIERMAMDRDDVREQLRITLLHEVGHHLGWDEDDLAVRGLA